MGLRHILRQYGNTFSPCAVYITLESEDSEVERSRGAIGTVEPYAYNMCIWRSVHCFSCGGPKGTNGGTANPPSPLKDLAPQF